MHTMDIKEKAEAYNDMIKKIDTIRSILRYTVCRGELKCLTDEQIIEMEENVEKMHVEAIHYARMMYQSKKEFGVFMTEVNELNSIIVTALAK